MWVFVELSPRIEWPKFKSYDHYIHLKMLPSRRLPPQKKQNKKQTNYCVEIISLFNDSIRVQKVQFGVLKQAAKFGLSSCFS